MNIGIVCFATPGGSGIVASDLAVDLARRGHDIHVVSGSLPPRLFGRSEGLSFHAIQAGDHPVLARPDPTLALAGGLADLAVRERLDLIHVHYADPHAISACLAREMLRGRHRVAVVTTLHGTDVPAPGSGPSHREVTRFAVAGSDCVTAVSQSLAAAAREAFGLRDVRVIPNFVEVTRFQRTEPPAGWNARWRPRGEKLLVHVSNFRPVKRTLDCVAILARLSREIPCRLLMVGNGPDADAARALAVRLGVAEDVLFIGEQADVIDYLSIADLLLLPSGSESFGVAALEAMSCGVPVVASRVGGLPEVVADGVCGRLLPVGDIDAMAAAALDILSDGRLAEAMGIAGRRIATEQFSASRIVPQYLECYREVIGGSDAAAI